MIAGKSTKGTSGWDKITTVSDAEYRGRKAKTLYKKNSADEKGQHEEVCELELLGRRRGRGVAQTGKDKTSMWGTTRPKSDVRSDLRISRQGEKGLDLRLIHRSKGKPSFLIGVGVKTR